MKTTKLFLTFVLIGIFQISYAQWDVIATGHLTNTNAAAINVNLNFYDGTSATSATVVTDVNGYYSHTFTGTSTSNGTVELIVHDCNTDTIYEVKPYNVSTGDTLVNFTTADYCPTTSTSYNIHANGQLLNTNGMAIPVTIFLAEGFGFPTDSATVTTDTNGYYTHTFVVTQDSGSVSLYAQDCNLDSIFEYNDYWLLFNDTITNFATYDYCPTSPNTSSVYASGNFTNTNSAAINVSLVLFDGTTTTTTTVVTDNNGNYSHTFSTSATSQGTIYMYAQDCFSDSIFETKTYNVSVGDTTVNYTTFDYCPVITPPTSCFAYFSVSQALDTSGTAIASQLIVTDSSSTTGTGNLTYTWNFGDGNTGTGSALSHTYSGNGPYVLCLTIADTSGCTAVHCDTISIDSLGMLESEGFTLNIGVEPTLSIEKIDFSSILSIFPNPAVNFINIEYNTVEKALNRITMVDLSGKVVFEESNSNSSSNMTTINTENIAPGTYLIQMLFDNEIHNAKVIIK